MFSSFRDTHKSCIIVADHAKYNILISSASTEHISARVSATKQATTKHSIQFTWSQSSKLLNTCRDVTITFSASSRPVGSLLIQIIRNIQDNNLNITHLKYCRLETLSSVYSYVPTAVYFGYSIALPTSASCREPQFKTLWEATYFHSFSILKLQYFCIHLYLNCLSHIRPIFKTLF